ncbi:UDP sugar transporter protein SLC35A4 [Fasciola gigantica]|uniref:UDP sugar transporter protein SLC35A4 n=1 Tax=Fasciola gigantica TaxID=46835 RepID=A0A504ZDL1_FASGI|nr:UDP sugar transporter protein SLC35A4 [Fasciola gigantica]
MFAKGVSCCGSERPFSTVAQAVRAEFRKYRVADASHHEGKISKSPDGPFTPLSPLNHALPLSWSELFFLIVPFTVPAILYAINNNLGMFMQLEMDPATYQVLGNFKILSTAILFRLIIRRPLSLIQWFSLLLLLLAGITHSYGSLMAKNAIPSSTNKTVGHGVAENTPKATFLHISIVGIFMISIYCTISGLSGVYTEYVMKKRAQMSIHLQNAMLYVFGVLINGLAFVTDVLCSDDNSASWNVFKGFSHWTWLLIITQSVSGIFMGFVMKFSNNITRLFIISAAMLVTTFSAMLVFSLHLNAYFVASFILVFTSLYLYHF